MYTIKQKSPRTVRGTATIHEDDRIEFKPYAEGESTQLNVRTTKGGKLFTTTSEKEPKQVAHLTCPLNTTDPWQEYIGQLERLGIKPQNPEQIPERQRLVSEGGMQVFLDGKRLTYQGFIDLSLTRNWQSEVMRQLQIIVRTLPGCEKFKRIIDKNKKGGTK